MVALAWVGAAEVSSLRGAVCARAECAQTTEDRQWRVVRGQSTEGRAAGSRHATRVRAARCALLNSVSSVPQCGQTGRGPFLIRSMPPPGPMGAATGNGDPRGSSAGRRPAARSPAGGSVIPAVPERSPCGVLMAGAGRGQRATAAPPARCADRSRVGTRVVAAVARGAESRDRGRVGGGATHAQSVATRAAAKRGKLITVSEWRAPPTGPRPDRSACPDGSSTAPPLLTPERPGPESLDVWAVGRWRRRASFALNRIDSNRVHEHGDSSFTRSARTVAQCRECARYRIDVSASTISGHSHSLCTVSSCRASVGEDVGARNRRPCRPVQERWSHCAR